jgi:hypothetical protein
MRNALLAALALVAITAVPASGLSMSYAQAYQVRGAVGDIPSTTNVTEPAGAWNLEQRVVVQHAQGTPTTLNLRVPAGAAVVHAACSCPVHFAGSGQIQSFALNATLPSGPYTILLTTSQPTGAAFGFTLDIPPTMAADSVAILFVPDGNSVDSSTSPGQGALPCTDGKPCTIEAFGEQGGLGTTPWFTLHPASTVAAPSQQPAAAAFPWLTVGLAFLGGAIVWALLVQRGIVQRKGRKQVAQAAAHEQIAATDPPAVLEGKKRALLAALKEVEMAKQGQEMDAATYDAVKAEFKRQAVTVMRAIEEADGKKA